MHFIFPPRPMGKINPEWLPDLEASGRWVAQYKYNGTRNLGYIEPDRTVLLRRPGKPNLMYEMSEAMRQDILSLHLEPGKRYVLDGELMHSKTKTLKDTFVVYDILWEGDYLYGTTVESRLKRLDRVCDHPTEYDPNKRALVVNDHIWMAPTFTEDFPARYAEAVPDAAREGLMLKMPDAKLTNMGGKEYEVEWQLRVRKPHAGGTYNW